MTGASLLRSAALVLAATLLPAARVSRPAGVAEIVVTDASGTPVTRVALSVRAIGGGEAGAWRWRDAAGGRVAIDGLEPGTAYVARVRSETSAVAVTRVLLPGGPALAVALRPGRAVSGVVVDKATGATVSLALITAIGASSDPCALVEPLTTGGDGAFALVGLPVGAKSVRVFAPGRPARSVPLGAIGDAAPLRVELDAADTASVSLAFDAPPPAGESWTARLERPGSGADCPVDAAGAFAAPPLPPGRYDVVLTRASESERWTWRSWVHSLPLPARAPRPISVRKGIAAGEVRARVVAPGGAPAAGVVLRAIPVGLPQAPEVLATTAADGTARLPGLPKARTWIAVDGTLAGAWCDVPEAGTARAEIEIPGGRASVTLLEEGSKKPIAGGTVRVAYDDGAGTATPPPPAPAVVGTADDRGVVRLEALPSEILLVEAGTTAGLLPSGRTRLLIGKGAADATAEVSAVRGGFVAGSAFRDGAPIDGPLRVVLRDGATGQSHALVADRDGAFLAGPLGPGRHRVFAYAPGGAVTSGVAAAATEPGAIARLDLDLIPGGTLDVRVTAADPAKLRRVRIVAEPKSPAAGEPTWAELLPPSERNDFLRAPAMDATGRTRVVAAPPGAYRVKAVAPDNTVLAEDDAVVASGEATLVALKIP